MKKGKLEVRALDRSVLRFFFRQREKEQLVRDGQTVGAGDTAVVTKTLIYGGIHAEPLVFFETLNAAFAENVRPDGLQLFLTLPVAEDEERLAERMRTFHTLADAAGLRVLGGHTAVSDAVTRPVLTLSISGEKTGEKRRPEAGEALLMLGNAGESGAGLLTYLAEEPLKSRFPESYLKEARTVFSRLSLSREAQSLKEYGASLQPVAEGGLLYALYAFAEGFRRGISVDLKNVPLSQAAVEICEALPEKPDLFSLYAAGCMLAALPEENAAAAMQRLLETGIPAARIGSVTAGPMKELRIGDHVRDLPVPAADPLLFYDFG